MRGSSPGGVLWLPMQDGHYQGHEVIKLPPSIHGHEALITLLVADCRASALPLIVRGGGGGLNNITACLAPALAQGPASQI